MGVLGLPLAFGQATPNTPAQNPPAQNQPAQNLPERMLNRLTAQQFVTDAALGGMKEIQTSKIALEKSQNGEVRKFAHRMVTDHSAANMKLMHIAQAKGLDFPATNTFAPDDPQWNNPMLTGSEQVKEAYLLTTNLPVSTYQDINRLKSLSGIEFDRAYALDMVNDHIMTVQEFELAQRDLTDPQLRQFAAETLPTLREHLQMAQRLENEVGAQAGTSATAYPNGSQTPQTRPASTEGRY